MTQAMALPSPLSNVLSALGPDLRARPVAPADEALLHTIYASTRQAELAALGETPLIRDTFVSMQFEAQRRHFVQHHPDSTQWLIERGSAPVGRLWLSLNQGGLQVLDITVLPEWQGQGIGGACLRHLARHADAQEWAMALHVRADNPARHWYTRMGFVTTDTSDIYMAMNRPPVDFLESRYEQA